MDTENKLNRITTMMEDFQKSLQAATSSGSNPPNVTESLTILETAFKMFREFVTGELESIRESLSKVEELDERLENQEQYSRRNCLLLRGIPEPTKPENEEECLAHVMRVVNHDLKLSLPPDVVSRCHRLGGRGRDTPRTRPIIIKFYSYRHRREVFGVKKRLQGKPHSLCEFLTIQRLKILRQARQTHGMKNVWTSDGKILINVTDPSSGNMRRVVVKKLQDIPPTPQPIQQQSLSVPSSGTVGAGGGKTPPSSDDFKKTWDLRSKKKNDD